MKKLFAITIGQDENGYCVNIASLTDNKVAQIASRSLRSAVSKLNKLLREKAKEVRNFPLSSKVDINRIVLPDDARPRIILASPNGHG